jgi:D-alanine--poly(phosphoribitol) ligase subunit 2
MAPVRTREPHAAIAKRVNALFERALQFTPPSIDTDLFETSALDSLSFVTLLAGLEQEFGVEIPIEEIDLQHFASIAAITRFVIACQDHGDSSTLPAVS